MSRPASLAVPRAVHATSTAPGRSVLRDLPVNLFAAVMGLSGLAMAWRQAVGRFGAPPVVGEAIGGLAVVVFVALLAGYAWKFLRHRDVVASEFAHPVAGNFFGTPVIAALLVSALVEPYSAAAGVVVWAIGTIATFALGYVVVARLLRGHGDPSHAVPAWLIPGVATLDIAVTGAHLPFAAAAEVNAAALAVGGVMALVLFTLAFQRMVQREPLPATMTPSMMVMVAPFPVGFLAWTSATGEVDRLASLLFWFGLFLFLVIAPKVFRRDVPFTPAWWAISFPIAALANAALRYAGAHPDPIAQAIAAGGLAFVTGVLAVLALLTLQRVLHHARRATNMGPRPGHRGSIRKERACS